MSDGGNGDDGADEQQRKLVRTATGVLIARYGLSADEAEGVLMDWSRGTEVPVLELAERLLADARRGTPDGQGALDLLRRAPRDARPDRPAERSAEAVRSGVDAALWERALVLMERVHDAGVRLAETADRAARTYDAVAEGRERRAARSGDEHALRRARAIRQKAEAERDVAAHLRRLHGTAAR